MPSDPILTVFAHSPDGGRGLARDMPVRWALEEVGQPYAIRGIAFAEMTAPEHLARNPFGQIPTFEDGSTTIFESGAIVLHIARRHPGLLPRDPAGAERAIAWMFAAQNTVEPPIVEREQAEYWERDRPWFADRQALMDDRIRARLKSLSASLGLRDWLTGAFTVADILMISVLRRVEGTELLAEYPDLIAYIARGTARPAYTRAFAAQRTVFEQSQREDIHAR